MIVCVYVNNNNNDSMYGHVLLVSIMPMMFLELYS